MKQIRLHGRGGQGVVTAAELIAIAAYKDGKQAQAFPSFGVERTGAPIQAFARIDERFIRTREQVSDPDVLIILDSTLLPLNPTSDCGENVLVVVNTSQEAKDIKLFCGQDKKPVPKENIYAVDATKIAMEIFGKNLSNTTILGALAKIGGLITIDGLKEAVKEKFSEKGEEVINKNIEALERTYHA